MSNTAPPNDLMEAIMKDPAKRALVLQLLAQNKDGIEAYKRRGTSKAESPLKKARRGHCESPTALHRRRALERNEKADESSSSSSSNSTSHNSSEFSGPKLPFDQLLKGVKAYVEVKRDGVDKSGGIKAIMKCMGAVVKDDFTSDVTHIVFKDGSFPTYQKAKLMKKHLVSVLWLDAVRRHNKRVPEKSYPAFGNNVCDENVSILCSQLQKDYEDIVKDEKRRTLAPVPKATTLKTIDKNRRKTLLTPKSSTTSYHTALKSTQLTYSDNEDAELKAILENDKESPELTSDDSDCGVVDGHSNKHLKHDLLKLLSQSMDKKPSSVPTTSKIKKSLFKTKISPLKSKPTKEADDHFSDDTTPSNLLLWNKESSNAKESTHVSIESSSSDETPISTKLSKRVPRLRNPQKESTNQNPQFEDSNSNSNSPISKSTPKNKRKTLNVTADMDITSNVNQSCASIEALPSTSPHKTAEEESVVQNLTNILKESTAQSTTMSSLRLSDNTDRTPSGLEASPSKSRASSNQASHMSALRISSEKKADKSNSSTSVSARTPKKSADKENFAVGSTSPNLSEQPVKVSKIPRQQLRVDPKPAEPLRRSRRSSVAPTPKSTPRSSDKAARTASAPRSTPKKTNDLQKTPKTIKSLPKVFAAYPVVTPRAQSKNDDDKNRKTKAATSSDEKTKGKTRKLYNPNEIPNVVSPEDERKEREEYLKNKSKKSPAVFINPNDVSIATLPKRRVINSSSSSDDGLDDLLTTEVQTKKKVKKPAKIKATKRVSYDSNADEQTDLLAIIQRERTRRSERISLSQARPVYNHPSSESSNGTSLYLTPKKRRSTLDFQTISQSQQKTKLKMDPKVTPRIVCTKLHRTEVRNFEATVKKLGRFLTENEVSDKTTHLVAGEAKRTVNILKAIARGCWILKHEWLTKSKELGKWLPEEEYELTEFSSAVQTCRLQRRAFGPKYSMDIFENCGLIYVARNTTPASKDLRELVILCKGTLTTQTRNASIVVGEYVSSLDDTCVTEMWILDSISFNRLKKLKSYLIKPVTAGRNSPDF